jgi:excisionase family DNA binding protein
MAAIDKKDVLTTGEVAKICHVAPRTVSKWFDTGKLRGYRIPGSRDRRIPRKQLEAFMRAHGIPLDELDGGVCRVLVVDAGVDGELIEAMERWDRYELRTAANGFEAGVVAEKFRPHVIVLDVGSDPEDAAEICRRIKSSADLQAAKVIAATPAANRRDSAWVATQGFDGWLAKPYSPDQLTEAIEKTTNLIG